MTEKDADVVRGAQAGDVSCLGVLLARHRAGMHAVALALLGYGPEAEDAVQDAALVAVRRIGDLQDAEAVGSWLRAIVRNICRTRLRDRREIAVDGIGKLLPPVVDSDPARVLEQSAVRDWVWGALSELSPPLRLVAILRYFTDVTAYDQIAALCGVPVGTVRSRLSMARTKIAGALLATADLAHADAGALLRRRRAETEDLLAAAHAGTFARALSVAWSPEVMTTWPDGRLSRGHGPVVQAMERDMTDGVRYRLADVVAGPDVIVLRTDLINPPDDPTHCPPAAMWVQQVTGGRVQRVRLFHPCQASPGT